MPKAKKLPSGNWRVQVYLGKENGKKIVRSVTCATKKEAEAEAAKLALQRELTCAGHITLCEAIDAYIAEKQELLSPSSIRGWRVLQRNSYPELIDRDIKSLTEADLARQMIKNLQTYAQRSVANQFSFLRTVLCFHKIQVPVPMPPRRTKSEIRVPTLSEMEKIVRILRDTDIECQILLALTCSLRQSEISGLTAENIQGDTVFVSGARIYDEHSKMVWKETNKTATSRREIVMPQRLALLMEQKCTEHPTGFLFPMTPGTVLKKFKMLLKENDLPAYTVHAMRHAFAAFAHHQGIPEQYILDWGGWSSPNIMKSVYRYAFADQSTEIKKNLNEKFSTLGMG